MDDEIGISSDRRCEMRIKRNVESEVVVFSNVEHASAEIFGSVDCLV